MSKEFWISLAVIIAFLLGITLLGNYWNKQLMQECISKGGHVVYDSDSNMDKCVMPKEATLHQDAAPANPQ